jgi:hypothetical protein
MPKFCFRRLSIVRPVLLEHENSGVARSWTIWICTQFFLGSHLAR